MHSFTVLAALSLMISLSATAAGHLLYVGTYTGAKSQGIYAFRFDDKTGETVPLGLAAKSENPSFLAIHPTGKFLYAANEIDRWQGKSGGSVTAFSIHPEDGHLQELSQQGTLGESPCHLSTDAKGRQLFVANYGGGSVVSLPILKDGSVGPHTAYFKHSGSSINSARQKQPHAHSINPSPDGRFVWAADLGTDRINAYSFHATRGLTASLPLQDATLSPGSGPRHLAFSPDGRHAYVINEMLSTITTFRYDAKVGKMTDVGTVSTLPPGTRGASTSTAEIRVHSSGKFVYGSNRGHDSIAVFSRDTLSGNLTPVEITKTGGENPRNFNIDPSGRFLFAAGQSSDDIRQFQIDAATGRLTSTGRILHVGSPVCLRFVPLK